MDPGAQLSRLERSLHTSCTSRNTVATCVNDGAFPFIGVVGPPHEPLTREAAMLLVTRSCRPWRAKPVVLRWDGMQRLLDVERDRLEGRAPASN